MFVNLNLNVKERELAPTDEDLSEHHQLASIKKQAVKWHVDNNENPNFDKSDDYN
jgi:hypothetical protein